MGRRGRGSCQGCIFAGTFGLLLRQASLGVNFCAPPAAESKPQKFPYAPLKHNLATRAGKLRGKVNANFSWKINGCCPYFRYFPIFSNTSKNTRGDKMNKKTLACHASIWKRRKIRGQEDKGSALEMWNYLEWAGARVRPWMLNLS